MHDSVPLETRRSFELPLTLGVISDTHVYASSKRQVPHEVHALFRRANVDLILHLGDVNTREVLDDLSEIAPVLAVVGNNDDDELYDALPTTITFSVGPYRFGMIHGHGGRSAKQQVRETFGGKVDMAFFGHSHVPFIGEAGKTILFNPGSATDRRWHEHFGLGIVHVTDRGIDPELILFTNPAHLGQITFSNTSVADAQAQENS